MKYNQESKHRIIETNDNDNIERCLHCNRKKMFPGEGGYTNKGDWYCCNNCLITLIENNKAEKHSHYGP